MTTNGHHRTRRRQSLEGSRRLDPWVYFLFTPFLGLLNYFLHLVYVWNYNKDNEWPPPADAGDSRRIWQTQSASRALVGQ
jgi:hypothetical protein